VTIRAVRHRRVAGGDHRALRRAGGRTGPLLPGPGRPCAAPAGHRLKVGGITAAVIDAKYKAEKPAGYPNADLYQLLAYCTILGLPVGHLVYARGNATPARRVVRQAGVEILCHAIDLSQPPDQLIEQMSNLAELVTAMAITSCRYPV
jgi:McrBC 5-methylcytosine restriction system component